MGKTLPNIEYSDEGTAIVDSPDSEYLLLYDKNEEYFSNFESKNRFIKGCEKLVRKSARYKKYINKLKRKVKLNHCQVLHNLTDDLCTIEMHHGPIFTLYDYCEIIIDYYLRHNWRITTFLIADEVLKEHWKDNIQVVMLSTTMHQEVHDREIFINIKQAYGNLSRFLKKYKLNDDLKEKYNRYLDKCEMMDSSSYDILKLNDKLINGER